MTDAVEGEIVTSEDGTPAALVGATITFRGREIKIKPPTAEALTAMQLMAMRYRDASAFETAEQGMRGFRRMITAVTALIEDDDDKDFVEDLFMNGALTVNEAVETLFSDAFAALEVANGNREQRRTATRRAPRKATRQR